MRRLLSATATLGLELALACVLALGAGLVDLSRVCARHRVASALATTVPVVGAFLWLGVGPMAAVAVAAAVALVAGGLRARRVEADARHMAGAYTVSSGDPEWWPQFEEAFWRECRLREQSRSSRHDGRDR